LSTDNARPSLSTTNTFQVVVNEINVAPGLTLPAKFRLQRTKRFTPTTPWRRTLIFPQNSLTFALVSGPPGLNVSPAGAITWNARRVARLEHV